ncbi:hypothetical protein [Adhaeribacter soli]|uniref:Uncharacterized protein n=1 Tax=Adhaeribacter soli TaxID=2607655 RepID=A0A5N1ITC4_9BACT|nr:hypothetical protein [Adhaeribacter soli]KAA9331159.1 hypothetical protein F0P94_14795 [Adhaeribacter soli]
MTLNLNNADYLVKSDRVDINELMKDNIELYRNMLSNKDTDETWKVFIEHFLLPYRISYFKFIYNKEYYTASIQTRYSLDEKKVSPTLLFFTEVPNIREEGYPEWFYMAFPDIADWVILGEGIPVLKQEFAGISKEKLIINGQYTWPYLKMVIELYKSHTNNMLECEMYPN